MFNNIINVLILRKRGDFMEKNYSSCCFTGYRPEKFPFPLDSENPDFQKFENALFEQVLCLAEAGCRTFYCGMAMGFDIISAETVLAVKNAFSEPLKLICVLPFKKQSLSFSNNWKQRFDTVLSGADETVVLSEKYHNGCYQQRNIYMVDSSDYVITWFDGKSGGTQNTLRYAKKIGRHIFNIYENPESVCFQEEIVL